MADTNTNRPSKETEDVQQQLNSIESALPELQFEWPTIDNYELIRKIGHGGNGTVYEAKQLHKVQRPVAIKVINLHINTGDVVARFEAERQAMARMNHPSIVKIFDAGVTKSGQPFVAMELVKGVPITDYCNTRKPTQQELLALFVQVCDAIQHAHHKGVIHRDITPNNVLVTDYSGPPAPMVIDFGIAKAIASPLTEIPLYTQHGAIMGALDYMSPEQAGVEATDIDTRSDIYGLGALLYELLAGTPPLDLKGKSLKDQLRTIEAVPPTRPSVRLSSVLSKVGTLGKRFGSRKVKTLIRRDLDCIVLKCLEKNRQRRYDTASSLAEDIERYLANEPVKAIPPSEWYRLCKFTRRHRAALVVAGLVGAALVGLTTFSIRKADVAQQSQLVAMEQTARAKRAQASAIEQAFLARRAEGAAKDAAAKAGRAEEAALEANRRLNAELAESFMHLGDLASSRGKWLEGVDYYQRAINAGHPNKVGLAVKRVEGLLAASRTAEAVKELDRLESAGDLGEYTGKAKLLRGEFELFRVSSDESGRTQIRDALRRGLNPADAAYARALLAANTADAIEQLSRAIKEEPFHHRANVLLCLLLTLSGRFSEVHSRVTGLEVLFPQDPNFRLVDACALQIEGNRDAGRTKLQGLTGDIGSKNVKALQAVLDSISELQGLGEQQGGNAFSDTLTLISTFRRIAGAWAEIRGADDLQLRLLTTSGSLPYLSEALREIGLAALKLPFGLDQQVLQHLDLAAKKHQDGAIYCFMAFVAGQQVYKQRDFTAGDKATLERIDALARQAQNTPSVIATEGRWARLLQCEAQRFLARPRGNAWPADFQMRLECLSNIHVFLNTEKPDAFFCQVLTAYASALGDYELARSLAIRWEWLEPKSAAAACHRAQVELRAKEFHLAMQAADRALQLAPENPEAAECRRRAIEGAKGSAVE